MLKIKQMRMYLVLVRIAAIAAFILIVSMVVIAQGGGGGGQASDGWVLTETQMWIIGVLGSYAAIVAAVLWRHDHDITALQSRPKKVPEDVCLANMTLLQNELNHGVARFEKIEATFLREQDAASKRHDELMNALREMNK